MIYCFEGCVTMRKSIKTFICLLGAALLLSGCSMRTVDEMYALPKRSKDYSNLQAVMDNAMEGYEFCAPLSGENQQSVQMADVDGDGEQECIVFAKSSFELPLRVLVFDRKDGGFYHTDTIESNGTAFDQVEYIQMDDKPGVEMVIGRLISDQLVRSVSVYTFATSEAVQLISANYRKFVAVDMDVDGHNELFVLRPGQVKTENGVAEFYSMENGVMERSNEVNISGPVEKLKRILVGKLHDEKIAVYVASTVEDISLITDVFAKDGERLTNISLSDESGTSVETLRNYYIYADDMDDDGVVELPRLVGNGNGANQKDMILWYAMDSQGNKTDKLYTYYDAAGGWYLELDKALVDKITVNRQANVCEFYLWNQDSSAAQKLMTVYTLTGQNREEQSLTNGRFVLLKTDTVTYAASLDVAAAGCNITQQSLSDSFNLIHMDWNSGEM